jgi:phosphoglucosamine mutase
MSNAGLERYLGSLDLKLARAPVGDRYVIARMWKEGFNVGGEQSGHIVLRDFCTTGDGIIAALQVLGVLAQEKRPASEASHIFEPLPQVIESVRYRNGSPLSDEKVKERIKDCEARMNGAGRIIVRKSGTEPVIRVMAEGDDEKLVRSIVNELVAALKDAVA